MKEKTALVIEDSLTQASHLQDLLEGEGMKAVLAENGKKGLEEARRLLPDVILLDLEMPGMDGLEVCEKLKDDDKTNGIPIILFTRHDESETVARGFQVGAIEYIPKDAFADVVLVETLKQMKMI